MLKLLRITSYLENQLHKNNYLCIDAGDSFHMHICHDSEISHDIQAARFTYVFTYFKEKIDAGTI